MRKLIFMIGIMATSALSAMAGGGVSVEVGGGTEGPGVWVGPGWYYGVYFYDEPTFIYWQTNYPYWWQYHHGWGWYGNGYWDGGYYRHGHHGGGHHGGHHHGGHHGGHRGGGGHHRHGGGGHRGGHHGGHHK